MANIYCTVEFDMAWTDGFLRRADRSKLNVKLNVATPSRSDLPSEPEKVFQVESGTGASRASTFIVQALFRCLTAS